MFFTLSIAIFSPPQFFIGQVVFKRAGLYADRILHVFFIFRAPIRIVKKPPDASSGRAYTILKKSHP